MYLPSDNIRPEIPTLLGFSDKKEDRDADRNRDKPYSALSYQARYLLYEDEAEKLVNRYSTHHAIKMQLEMRYERDKEYRSRINGGYTEMERKMRESGVIPQGEMDLVDQLNATSQAPKTPFKQLWDQANREIDEHEQVNDL